MCDASKNRKPTKKYKKDNLIIIEVDEGQHKQYTKECEFIRMNNIYLANGLPTIFIRFNLFIKKF